MVPIDPVAMHEEHLDHRRERNDREAGYPENHSRGGSVLPQIPIRLSQALELKADQTKSYLIHK